MQITQGGFNPAAFGVPDLYVGINPPPAAALPGAPSNIIGIVGVATWGPVNAPVVFGDMAGASAAFGQMQNRKYDLLTQVYTASMQGANGFVGVRATDGTDAAASVVVQSTCITLTAKYTGTLGNSLQAVIGTGTAPSSFKVTLSLPGQPPETFDNLTGSGNALWIAMASAINNGQSATRGPSNLATATAGVGTTAPTLATLSLAGGVDGAASITATVLIGADTTPRTGMYALRNSGFSLLVLADADASSSWAAQLAFAKSELAEAICCNASGDSISAFTTAINGAGIDDPWAKVLLGDWPYVVDGVNNLVRLVSPQGFVAGAKAVRGPHQSILNYPLLGVVGTQKTKANLTYSSAELQSLASARGDVITAPSVGGPYFSARFGRNASSDPSRLDDSYTTMTNYLAKSLALSLGGFVGRLITPDEMREAASSIGGFLENEKQAGRIDSYYVQIDNKNNPDSQKSLGIQKATVQVKYFNVNRYFLIDFTGGGTVVPATAQAAA